MCVCHGGHGKSAATDHGGHVPGSRGGAAELCVRHAGHSSRGGGEVDDGGVARGEDKG